MKTFFPGYCTAVILSIILASCKKTDLPYSETDCTINISAEKSKTKSSDPDESLISDFNIFIFNDRGLLEYSSYIKTEEMHFLPDKYSINVKLMENCIYSIYIMANIGYSRTNEIANLQDLDKMKIFIAYPDEYRYGIPMSGCVTDFLFRSGTSPDIKMEKLMSKISLSIDRSRLNPDISFIVRQVTIGGCPKMVLPFAGSTIKNPDDMFSLGFTRSGTETAPLNDKDALGKSNEISVYMFENLQGDLLKGETDYRNKILESHDPKSKLCSYIEMKIEYTSQDCISLPSKNLIYRFYLGESPENFDIVRNCSYHFTVTPENDGLSEHSWRVDQSGLTNTVNPYMKIYPGNYIRGKIGEKHHIRCEYSPSYTEFDIGLKELEYDKERGIYDYELDTDGKGVTLTLKNRGSGILYFKAGYPINQEEMVFVEVD